MILKDFQCQVCGMIVEDSVPQATEMKILPCNPCGKETLHISRCNGGVRLRVFLTPASLAGRRWSDEEVRIGGFECEMSDGRPVIDLGTGERIDERDEFQAESTKALTDEVQSAQDRRAGRTPIVMDLGAKNAD